MELNVFSKISEISVTNIFLSLYVENAGNYCTTYGWMNVEQRNVVTISYFVVIFHEVELPKQNFVKRVIVIFYIKNFVPWGTLFYRFVKDWNFKLYNITYYIFCWNKLAGKFCQSSGWNKYLPRNKRNCIQNVINARLGDFECSWWKVYIYP